MDFQELLKSVLKAEGLTSAEASRRCGIKNQQFHGYLKGRNLPSFDKAIKILSDLNWQLIPTFKTNETTK